jgi:hypothetical protein
MAVLDEENKQYKEFANAILKDLGCGVFDPETMLWRYTKGAGL